MTPEERDLITTLLDRLGSIAGQPKDPEADRLIRQAVGRIPDAPYYLVQTVVIQDITLHQAEARIAELEEQLAAAEARQPAPTSFLGGLFGRGQRAQSSGAMPRTGPRDYGPESRRFRRPRRNIPHPAMARRAMIVPGILPVLIVPEPLQAAGFSARPQLRRRALRAVRCWPRASPRCSAAETRTAPLVE
jgi:hypothetical protein